MIDYFKKVVILKPALNATKQVKGVCIVKSLNGKTSFDFNFSCNLDGLTIYISGDNDNIEKINLKGLSVTFNDFKVLSGVTIAVFDKNNLICLGEYGKSYHNLNGITKYAKKEYFKNEKEQDFTAENSTANQIEKSNEYNDELIATENYYQIENDKNTLPIENATWHKTHKKAEEIEENKNEFREYEALTRTIKNCDYYEKIKDKLEDIFIRFEECNDLTETLPNSKFVKIKYNENDYYYFGKVYEKAKVKFICYGVTGYYNERPNELLKNFSFIPISNYELSGKGFYLIFQDAKTGEIIKNKSENPCF